MKTIILEGNDISNLKLILELAHKLNLKAQIINSEEKEDLALGKAILEEETGEYLTKEDLFKELSK
jgi:hypothetical protein